MSTVYDCARQHTREAGLAAAASAVRAGQLVVLPTDTLYGVGCDAFDSAAVRSLLEAKGRGRSMPVPVLVGSWATVDGLVLSVPSRARALIEAFWPGGLTIVLSHAPSLAWDLGDTRGTVALRMPLHPVALELLREVGPMGVSSANRSGHAPPITVEDARTQLGESVPVYLDAGPVAAGVASTMVDLTGPDVVVLREGAVSAAAISEVVGVEVTLDY
jgi:tRNA threonylcarbamoyl adenosine modification protein (Sua5/YciO/YrdC/YwlC family)